MIRLPIVVVCLCAAVFSMPASAGLIKVSDRPIIISRDTNKCLDVDPATSAVVLNECSLGASQRIRMNFRRGNVLPEYYLFTDPGPIEVIGKCLVGSSELGARVAAGACNGSPAQHWTFSSTNPALHYTMRNGLGLCIGVVRAVDAAPVIMVDCAGGSVRRWDVTSTEYVAQARSKPQRDALETQQRAKVRAEEARWALLWAKPAASEPEQRELEELAINLDRVTLSTKYEAYRGRYLIRNYAQLNRFCEQGYAFACERLGRTSTARAPSGGYSGGGAAPPSATVNVRSYDQYGNYKGTTTTTRTDAGLMGAK